MKNLVLAKLMGVLTVNFAVYLFVCTLILFRNRIGEMIDRLVEFNSYVFRSFASFMAFVLLTAAGFISYFGQNYGESLSNVAMDHVMPVVKYLLLEFATYLLMIFNYFLRRSIKERKVETVVTYEREAVHDIFSVFQKPSLSLLQ